MQLPRAVEMEPDAKDENSVAFRCLPVAMGDAPPESGRYVLELETNLHRAAVEGQRLLAENNTLEGAHRDLEERLAVADKRNSSLQRVRSLRRERSSC